MLAKINKIKNLGLVFRDFAWAQEVPDFRAVNLIYGWNGCGKTTFTRLFDELATSGISQIEYELEIVGGTTVRQGSSFPHPIRVFNHDYIQKNVRVLESRANIISVLLGEQNKELAAQIERNERELYGDPSDPTKTGKIRELDGFTQKKLRKEKGNETAFSDIARTIGAAIVGSGTASRTYRSPDAKRDFETLTRPALLEGDALDIRILALKQEQLPELGLVQLPALALNSEKRQFIDMVGESRRKAETLCSMTVEAEVIERLRDNRDIAEWVEQGRRIHAEHGSGICEYCGSTPTKDRLAQLARHFSDADQQIKAGIDSLLSVFRELYTAVNELSGPDEARLYVELQPAFKAAVVVLKAAKTQLLEELTQIGQSLKTKKAQTSNKIELPTALDTSPLEQAVNDLNQILKSHNKKSNEFKNVKDEAVRDIKAHYLSTIYEDIQRRNKDINELVPDLARRAEEIERMQQSIATARAAISSEHKACEQINHGLRAFLGHQELHFDPDVSTEDRKDKAAGYRIMRGTQPATHLSEGEKTAIAFVYFVVHLNDGQFQKDNGIVVIDDPISSLDSNSLYQAFSFLKNAVKDCRQIFVLTHNFEFLKLLINWRKSSGGAGYYMIRNEFVETERRAMIARMDKELHTFESEYHYLFKLLKNMRAEQDGTLMRAYPVPNIARKVWDTFLMYRVPSGENPYRKMEQLKEADFDAQKLDAIYKFTNDQSHVTGAGFNPALVPETKKVLEELFEMMHRIAPDHFAVLDKATPL